MIDICIYSCIDICVWSYALFSAIYMLYCFRIIVRLLSDNLETEILGNPFFTKRDDLDQNKYCGKGLERITVYPKKYAHGFCFAVLCCGYTLTDFPISIRLTSLALWQSNDCPSSSKATLMNMDKYFMWIHYERLHNHNKAKHNKTVCIFLGIYCMLRNYSSVL